MLKGKIFAAHDAVVRSINISVDCVELDFEHLPLYVTETEERYGVWSCAASLLMRKPTAMCVTWHAMSLWILDSEMRVESIPVPWETLLERQRDVSLEITWSNGAKLSVDGAEWALLKVTPLNRVEELAKETHE